MINESDNEQNINFGDQHQDLTPYQVAKYPFNCIGIIYYSSKFQGNQKGTGFLIGSDLVLTVAHNLYSKKYNQEFLKNGEILFYPGVSGQLSNPYKVVDYRIPHQYKTCQKNDKHKYDYALIKLDRKINRDQYFTLGTDFNAKVAQIGIFGYQGKKCKPAKAIQSGIWKNNSHTFIDSFLRYKISAQNGNSGSPAIIKKQQQKIAIAIHQGGAKSSLNKDSNQAKLITSQLVNNLLQWEKEMFKSQISLIDVSTLGGGGDLSVSSESRRSVSPPKKNHSGPFKWDPSTPFASNFLIQGKKVTMNKDDKSYQITSQNQIPKDSIANFRFKLLQYGSQDSVIIFGIITKVRKQQRSSLGLGQQSVGYQTSTQYKNAYIRIDGQQVQGWIGDGFVGVNNSLLMRVDTIKYEITFINSAKPTKQFKYQLKKKHWKGQQMYVYVTMRDKGDCIQVAEQ